MIISDAVIFKSAQRLGYEHWEDQIRELDAAMKRVGPDLT